MINTGTPKHKKDVMVCKDGLIAANNEIIYKTCTKYT